MTDPRLTTQRERLKATFGADPARWWTLRQLAHQTGASEAGISMRTRELRYPRYGGWAVEKRRHPDCRNLWQYRGRPPSGMEEATGLRVEEGENLEPRAFVERQESTKASPEARGSSVADVLHLPGPSAPPKRVRCEGCQMLVSYPRGAKVFPRCARCSGLPVPECKRLGLARVPWPKRGKR